MKCSILSLVKISIVLIYTFGKIVRYFIYNMCKIYSRYHIYKLDGVYTFSKFVQLLNFYYDLLFYTFKKVMKRF